jgi:hypothetical protein
VTDTRTAYMCGVDFQHHLGEDSKATRTYASVECLKEARECWKQCGIVEVEVRVKAWVEPQDFTSLTGN